MREISQETINKAAWAACDVFRGTVDASIYRDYVLTMLFVKYLSDVWLDHYNHSQVRYYDHPDLIEKRMPHARFQLPDSASFYKLYDERYTPGNGARIDLALHAIEEANISNLAGVFQGISFNFNKLGDEKKKDSLLRNLLEVFAKPELDFRPSWVNDPDSIGKTYEFLIKNFATTSGKKNGEFYTPPELSLLIARLIEPKEGDEICDPACGSASLLLKCADEIKKNYNGSTRFALYGQEASGSIWALAKMNISLREVEKYHIEWGNTIRNPKLLDTKGKLKQFDVVVANPPFSQDKWGVDIAEHDPFHRFLRGIPPKTKGDYAFILHMVETLKPDHGRMAVVVSHGVLSRGSSEGTIRRELIEENLLDAVIGLPEKLLYGVNMPSAILIFRKAKRNNKILFIDASHEYISGKNQNLLDNKLHVEKIYQTYKKSIDVCKYSRLVSLDEIRANDYNLNIPLYIDSFENNQKIDLTAIRNERVQLKSELAELENKMMHYLKKLGYDT